jgi:hypothetical protein
MPSAGFEPAFPAIKRLQSYTFKRTASGTGDSDIMLSLEGNKWFVLLQYSSTVL